MKILHLISGGDTGGAKTHIQNLLLELQKSIDVKLICFIKEDFYYELKSAGVNIEVYEQKRRYDFSVIKRLLEEIKKEQYDLIHCHGARANFLTAILKKFINIPTVTTVHSDYTLDFKGSFYKTLVYKSLNILSLNRMDYYVAVSNDFKEMLINRGFKKDKIFIIYNGINLEQKLNIIEKQEFLQKYKVQVEEDTIIICILARLYQVKGLDVFIKGAKEVLKENNNVVFLIGGDGPEENQLKDLIKRLEIGNKVHLLGYVADQWSLLNASDINTLTSHSESFPYAILEGGILKKPIVSSDVGGIKDLVIENETGLLFQPGDYHSLGQQLLTLIKDEELRKKLGQNLYDSISQNYSSKSMAKKQIEIYDLILKDKN